MFNLTLQSIVLYFLFLINVDSLFVSNGQLNQPLFSSSKKNFKNKRFLCRNLLFIFKIPTHNSKYELRYDWPKEYKEDKDSTWNPHRDVTKLLFSSSKDTVIELVNCSESTPPKEEDFVIPYKDIHTCAFDGHNSLSQELETLKEPLKRKCNRILNEHKSLILNRGMREFETNAIRSIKALTHWIGSRILYTAKKGRDNSEIQGMFSPEDSIVERDKCDEMIRKLVTDNLELWNLTNQEDQDLTTGSYPSLKEDKPEEYIEGVWSYFNRRVFRNLLPDFWEVDFGWFDILSDDHREKLIKSGEMFTFEGLDIMNFPKILYPTQLKSLPSSLGNCVFRSMTKLFCDTYSAFGEFNHVEVVSKAFQLVESNSSRNEGVIFTVIQRNYEKLVNYDSELVALFNANDSSSKEFDLNNKLALLLGTEHLPYVKNNFHLLSIYNGDLEKSLQIYEDSFKIHEEGLTRKIWFHNGVLTVPTNEIMRSLIHNDFDEFSTIMGLALNEIMKLKPLQLNFVQNRIVSTCVKFLNNVRSLEAYESNYLITQNKTTPNKTVEKINIPVIQSILFTMNLHEKSVINNNLYPLSNDFIRNNPLEGLMDIDQITQTSDDESYENSVFNRFMKQKTQEPVKFIKEYMDISVPPDDQDALGFLVSYYNFNLFGGRLPIDIKIKFKYGNYLSSNDISSSLSVPTIYLNPLIQNNKRIIPRLILNECIQIFLKWYNKFTYEPTKQRNSLDDIMEHDMEKKIKNHILNCTEQSLSWPFYIDDFCVLEEEIETDNELKKIFLESFETKDVVQVLDDSIKRESFLEIWDKKNLPIRDFLASLSSGSYDLAYSIISNPSSIRVTSKLNMNDLNFLENKFKKVCESYFNLQDPRDNKLNSVLYLESLSIVEAAFNELREQCIKNTLIYTKDLVEGIADVTNVLTNSDQVHQVDSSVQLDRETHTIKTSPNSRELSLEGVSFFSCPKKLTNEEALNLSLLLYNKYNKFLFQGFLPDPEIKFGEIEELSSFKVSLTDFSRPIILMNNLIDDINLLNSQLILQMVLISYYYFRHVTVHEFYTQFGHRFKSAFDVIHNKKMNLLKSKMIPVNLEKKINSTKDKKKHNKQYVDIINSTLDYKSNDLVTLQANDFIYEVLEGRENLKQEDKLSNHYESLQTLKAFANHYFNTLSLNYNYTNNMSNKSTQGNSEPFTDNTLDQNSTDNTSVLKKDELEESESSSFNDVLSFFSPGLMKNQWVTNMMDYVEKALKGKKIALFLQPSNTEWTNMLNSAQQEQVIEYVSRNPGESLYSILTKSGSFTKRESIDLIVKCIYNEPIFEQNKISEGEKESMENQNSISNDPTPFEVIKSDSDTTTTPYQIPIDDIDEFLKKEMTNIMRNIPPNQYNNFVFFFHKLLQKDFVSCRNVLNSCDYPSLLLDRSTQMLDQLISHNLLDIESSREIRKFLH